MAVAIYIAGNVYHTTEGDPQSVRRAIEGGETIRCWWFQSHGQRIAEDFWFPIEKVDYIRTESDD